MEIITESLKDDLEIQLNKQIDNITKEDLLEIKKITINRLGYGEKFQEINYDEIVYFENLEELNIFNCMINKKLMDNIATLKKLKILNIYNSDFIDYISEMFSSLNLERLTISNCLGLCNITLKDLKYLELKNIKNSGLLIKDIDTLNIANTEINIRTLSLANVKKIIISEMNYDDNIKYDNFNSKIIIVNDKKEIIKEIKNG